MGNGLHEWPLILFTVLGQSIAGGVIVTGLAWLSTDDKPQKQRIVNAMLALWVLMGLGFLASMMHMGSPMRAFNSMNRVFASSLSNEVLFGSIFFALGGLWWLFSAIKKMPTGLDKVWLIITMLMGLLFVWAMTRVYMISTVPTWNTPHTTIGFFMTLFVVGPILGTLLLRVAKFPFNSGKLAAISVVAYIVTIASVLLQSGEIALITTSVQKAVDLVPDFGVLQVVRIVVTSIGLLLWILPVVRQNQPSVLSLLLGTVLVLVGEFIGRGLFYGLHMTVGMAVA
ncbi:MULTISPECIES: DmsC/YnfH family molybdoenzyme membrane anchor subunit [Providencia]|uniref:DmsC/YnfH family molybdoenzyme membrane anchor subunit n=1 Tax=Providencia TaxID=586 RepID=UPI000807ED8F|nr:MULTISPECIES: DmsC/YnfH family molybdoenzyme membrane anchor subunit [Providencia]EJD6475472.1 dimethyl sulfoxide reductase anchor subunit family protein [Providencia rettgeri]ELH9583912.1 dimethyl sulfoxide reductase anchor subunit family protein [Providencia rettgeri]ELM3936947.1 dimethyl sulfoxide reductase anchor subunit family protein [Providencia rettgeri]ELR5065038.1 dimethyl sulfoxide reductase anchor subunit family protein [Providencia rettgeri]ELR5164083.1 dimethyl sulfoxide reduc